MTASFEEGSLAMDVRTYNELIETLPWILLYWVAVFVIFMGLIFVCRRIFQKRIDLDTIFSLSMIFSVIYFSSVEISVAHIVNDPLFYTFYLWGYVEDGLLNILSFLPCWLVCGPFYFIYLRRLVVGGKLCSAYVVFSVSALVFPLEYLYFSALFAGSM